MLLRTWLLLALLLSGTCLCAASLYSVTDLGTGNFATAINNVGQITRYSYNPPGHISAFLYSNGSMTSLGSLGGGDIYARAINDSGQVTGYAYVNNSSVTHAFLYSGGTISDLGVLGNGTYSWGQGSITPGRSRD